MKKGYGNPTFSRKTSKIKEPGLVIHKSRKLTFYDLYLMRLLAETRFSSNIASEKRFLKQHSNNCGE